MCIHVLSAGCSTKLQDEVANNFFENVRVQMYVNDIKHRFNSGNVCHHLVEKRFIGCLRM